MRTDLPEQIRRRLARFGSRTLGAVAGAVAGGRPIPLGYWLWQRRMAASLFGAHDALTFPLAPAATSGAAVNAPELHEIFKDDPPNNWALDPATIDLLWARLVHDRPVAAIECGAGRSTLLLARYAALVDAPVPFVISLEQDAPYAAEMSRRLAGHGLRGMSAILNAPLDEQHNYRFDPDLLAMNLGGRKAGWLVIDGPSGPEGCRAGTLPALARYCSPGARWFLDDAFRDGELDTLIAWERLPGVRVEGIYPVGKGLATGIITAPGKVGRP